MKNKYDWSIDFGVHKGVGSLAPVYPLGFYVCCTRDIFQLLKPYPHQYCRSSEHPACTFFFTRRSVSRWLDMVQRPHGLVCHTWLAFTTYTCTEEVVEGRFCRRQAAWIHGPALPVRNSIFCYQGFFQSVNPYPYRLCCSCEHSICILFSPAFSVVHTGYHTLMLTG